MPPVLLQVALTNLTATNAEMRVALNPRGVGGSVLIDLGATTNYGTTFSQALAAGVSDTALVIPLAGLASHTTYHQRVRVLSGGGGLATNSADATFTTPSRPVALTFAATNLTPSRATLQGAVQPDGTNVSAWFEYGRVSLGWPGN